MVISHCVIASWKFPVVSSILQIYFDVIEEIDCIVDRHVSDLPVRMHHSVIAWTSLDYVLYWR